MIECSSVNNNFEIVFRPFLWLLQISLGVVAGLMLAEASVTTHVTVLEQGGRVSHVRVEVRVCDIPIHEESGWINSEDGISELNDLRHVTVSMGQFLLVYGIIGAGGLIGGAVALAVGFLLARRNATLPVQGLPVQKR